MVVVVVAGPDFQMSTLSVSSCLTQSQPAAQRPHHPADTQIEFVASISTFYSRSRYYLWRYILVLLSVPRHPTSISLEPRYIYIHTFEESWLDLLDF